MKILSLTTTLDELKSLSAALRKLYFSCQVDGLSLVLTPAEAGWKANPWIHRQFREYTAEFKGEEELSLEELATAARRALLEERPDLVLFPANSSLATTLKASLEEFGIPSQHLNFHEELELSTLRELPPSRACRPRAVEPEIYLQEHEERLRGLLFSNKGPCLLLGSPEATEALQKRFPEQEFHTTPQLEQYHFGLSLFSCSLSPQPLKTLELLHRSSRKALVLEAVNTPLLDGPHTLRYGDYDNEFSLLEAQSDLKQLVTLPHTAEVWGHRSGCAGEHPLPNPDGRHPLFALQLGQNPPCWTDRYRLPENCKLKIVFADSGNVAGSVLHHASAVNRHTTSQAWAVALSPHPLIGTQHDDEETFFLHGQGKAPSARLQQVLEEADCFVFFEDDDENSANWPFPLTPYVEGKAVLHLYIGYRAHLRSPRLARPGRHILTPLPHILRMYPQATFYAGFPPNELLDIPLRPPRSVEDGVCRVLHSPSVPHWTTARYPYHKDTEAFLRVARSLKKKYRERVEFHQVGGWSQKDVILARQVCDITFNQLRGFHGLSGDEAMLLERPCIQAFDRSNTNRHREYWGLDAEFPWLSSDREQLQATLEPLLDDPDLRAEIGRRSRLFMLKYFSPQKGILPLLFHCYQAMTKGAESSRD